MTIKKHNETVNEMKEEYENELEQSRNRLQKCQNDNQRIINILEEKEELLSCNAGELKQLRKKVDSINKVADFIEILSQTISHRRKNNMIINILKGLVTRIRQ